VSGNENGGSGPVLPSALPIFVAASIEAKPLLSNPTYRKPKASHSRSVLARFRQGSNFTMAEVVWEFESLCD